MKETVFLCPECGKAYNDPEMLAALPPEESEWNGRLHRVRASYQDEGYLGGYQWYCGCNAVCFIPWGNEFLRYGIAGQPQVVVIGRLKERKPAEV